MLTNIDISEYIKVCTYLGSYNELIQGSGGNFSLKSDNEIIIKSSGRVLAETSNIYGYVICSLDKLNKSLIDKEISVNSCVLRGEQNGIPSMEVFFHLLPYKWVIHIHPTSFLVYLCQESWLTLRSTYSYCFIPYKTPGKDLGSSILEKFNDEQVFFLQNHGIIICANEIKEVYTILDDLYLLNIKNNICSIQKDEFVNIYSIKEYIEKKVEYTIVLKKCKNIKNIKDSFFHAITPDILLFLKSSINFKPP
jgi:ribulose-5-phosphate 4-epimerase/fuculose-1-phosphate aldolase